MITLPISLTPLGMITLFLWVFTGALGIPGSSVGIIAFGSTATTLPSILLMILIVYVAVICGDILAYTLAVVFSERFRNKLRRFSFFRDNEEKAKTMLKKYEFSIVFFTRFLLTGLCQVTSYISGFEGVSKKKFITAVLTGEFLFAVIYTMIGFAVGEVLNNLINTVNYLVIAVLLLALTIYLIVYTLRKRKSIGRAG